MNLIDKLCHRILYELVLKRQVQAHEAPELKILTFDDYQKYQDKLIKLP